jgi:hypothetical protein
MFYNKILEFDEFLKDYEVCNTQENFFLFAP